MASIHIVDCMLDAKSTLDSESTLNAESTLDGESTLEHTALNPFFDMVSKPCQLFNASR